MNKIKDTDLREALHRKYAETPKLPADFMTKMEEKLETAPSRVPSDPVAGKARRPWRWIAAAASLLLLIGIGVTLMPSGEEGESSPLLAKRRATTSKTTSCHQQYNELLSTTKRPQLKKRYPRRKMFLPTPLQTIRTCITHLTRRRQIQCPIRIQPVWTSSSPSLPIITR